MISYLYYDENGVLREFITSPIRKTASNNAVYIYFANETTPTAVSVSSTNSVGTTIATVITDFYATTEIPYDEKRTLKYFEYHKSYKFYYKNYDSTELSVAGVMMVTPTYTISGANVVLGTYPCMIEDNNISLDETMTYAMYYYLLNQIKGGFDTASASANTLAEGASATASVSYTESGALKSLNFTFGIPRGATGATGPQGIQGIQGIAGASIPTENVFGFRIDSDTASSTYGHLLCVYADGSTAPAFSLDTSGHLIYTY